MMMIGCHPNVILVLECNLRVLTIGKRLPGQTLTAACSDRGECRFPIFSRPTAWSSTYTILDTLRQCPVNVVTGGASVSHSIGRSGTNALIHGREMGSATCSRRSIEYGCLLRGRSFTSCTGTSSAILDTLAIRPINIVLVGEG